ncbi:site-specific integrase [Rhizobium sp. KVB221]|uniref:Site-specific integrase n=1 Tax=Rhizobium setariae TaxID=2801340 RepID=A0A936YPT3_9HYPH|nr:site-specific integrase [Rhizobium setariae]MBL0372602.1 site-specific integrase [Rhizobium setariae]
MLVSTSVSTFFNFLRLFMAKVTGLRKLKDSYFFVKRIPSDVSSHFGGRQQISIPLKTPLRKVAEGRARELTIKYDKQFDDARIGISPPTDDGPAQVSRRTLEDVARFEFFEELSKNHPEPASADDIHILELDLSEVTNEMERGEFYGHRVTPVLLKHKLPIREGEQRWFELAELLGRVDEEVLRRRIDRAKRNYSADTHDTLFAGISLASSKPKISTDKGVRLDELIARFEVDAVRASLTPKTHQKYKITFAAMLEILGPQTFIRDITREHCARIRDLIASLPSNHNKYKKFKGLTLADVAEKANQDGNAKLSLLSISGYVRRVTTVLGYAVDAGLLDVNPAAKLFKKSKDGGQRRGVYNSDELGRLLTLLPTWAEGHTTGRFWLPLVAMFTGMRLGEIIWLRREDIQVRAGVMCIALEETEERKLKTEASTRVVPLHSTLLSLGFGRLVDACRPGDRLFADLPGSNQENAVDRFQKAYSRWLKKEVRVRPRVTFHSFRHLFRDAMTNASLSGDAIRRLGGWTRGSSIENHYGEGARISKLAEWMEQVAYPELDIPVLVGLAMRPQTEETPVVSNDG